MFGTFSACAASPCVQIARGIHGRRPAVSRRRLRLRLSRLMRRRTAAFPPFGAAKISAKRSPSGLTCRATPCARFIGSFQPKQGRRFCAKSACHRRAVFCSLWPSMARPHPTRRKRRSAVCSPLPVLSWSRALRTAFPFGGGRRCPSHPLRTGNGRRACFPPRRRIHPSNPGLSASPSFHRAQTSMFPMPAPA